MSTPCRHLVVVLGDQLNREATAFDGFDPVQDQMWMCEASEESTHVWSSGACSFSPPCAAHARAKRSLRMEYLYREMRREHGVLMEGLQPCGGEWNFDPDNREAFGPNGPGFLPTRFEPDGITQQVMDLVESRFGEHPGQTSPCR